MGEIDKAVGALAIGTWTSLLLYTLELQAAWSYFKRYQHDHFFLRATVAVAVLLDTVAIVIACISVYAYAITHFGDHVYLQNQSFYIPVYCLTAGLSGFICQAYLTYRFFRLSKIWSLSIFLVSCSLVALVCGAVTSVDLLIFNSLEDRANVVVPAAIWLSFEAAVDVFISLSLIMYLSKYTKTEIKATRSLLYRLMIISAESGVLTAAIAAAVLLTYLLDKESNVTAGIGYNLGRLYTLTLLFNLNLRGTGDGVASSSAHDGTTRAFQAGQTFQLSRVNKNAQFDFAAVTVQHEVDIQIDEGEDQLDEKKVYRIGERPRSEENDGSLSRV